MKRNNSVKEIALKNDYFLRENVKTSIENIILITS